MGFLGGLVDDVFDLPGKIVEGTGKAIEKTVEESLKLPGKVVKGTVNGIKKGAEEIDKAFD